MSPPSASLPLLPLAETLFAIRRRSSHPFSDLWSAATVLAEVVYGQPLFRGATSIDYLVDVIKVRTLIFPSFDFLSLDADF